MKLLFICSTDYQIINAINIKEHLYGNTCADIILIDNKKNRVEVAHRLKEVSVFNNIFVCDESVKGIHYFLKNLTEGYQNISIAECIKNEFVNVYRLFCRIYKEDSYTINSKISCGGRVSFKEYSEIFCFDTNHIIRKCILLVKKINSNCKINFLDEGIGTYFIKNNYPYHIDKVFVYEPSYMLYGEEFNELIKIPKICLKERMFVEKLNYIFNFSSSIQNMIENKIIFFDQPWDLIPKYLNNFVTRLICFKSYKRHLKEALICKEQIKMAKVIRKKANNIECLVKLHPLTKERINKVYENIGYKFIKNVSIPWEIIGCNCEMKNNLFISVYSSALMSYDFTIKQNKSNKYIYLYKIMYYRNDCSLFKSYEDFKMTDEFFQNMKKVNKDVVFIPENIEELGNIINEMGRNKNV